MVREKVDFEAIFSVNPADKMLKFVVILAKFYGFFQMLFSESAQFNV